MDTSRRNFLTAGASMVALTVMTTAGCTTTSGSSSGDPATQRQAIDSAADNALTRLYAEVPGSRELVSSAKGVLVFPSFVSAGFMVGGAHGRGVMREGGKSTGYFRMTEGSFGWQIGAQSQAVFILFMTEDALKRFQASSGWTAGVDGSVAMATAGATAAVSTQTAQQPIVSYVLANAGLMAAANINGSRITRLDF
jgi:lipid-binding SYLF domain-containing protein